MRIRNDILQVALCILFIFGLYKNVKAKSVFIITEHNRPGSRNIVQVYETVGDQLEFQYQSDESMNKLAEQLILPTKKNSQKYSVPIFYINPMSFTSPWSKRLRKNGALLFKLWDRPVNALAKVCEYVSYRNKFF